MNKIFLTFTACALLSACAPWFPRVDNPSASYKEDFQYCDRLLGGYKADESALLGAGIGALTGLAIAGLTGADAGLTSGMGAALAGTGSYISSDQKYKENMIKCLKQQGHNVYE